MLALSQAKRETYEITKKSAQGMLAGLKAKGKPKKKAKKDEAMSHVNDVSAHA